MHTTLHSLCRAFLASMAFTMVFMLTPRAWVTDRTANVSDNVPVDVLEEPNSCLWCDETPTVAPADCKEDDQDQLWLNPDSPQLEECDDERDPNA